MIRFKCSCGQPYEVDDFRAGEAFQCPQCLRLVDVPSLGDLSSLEEDGTIKLQEPPVNPDDLAAKIRAHAHTDDLRQNIDEFFQLDQVPSADAPLPRRAPRYDPITGQRIQEIELAPDPIPPASIPPPGIPSSTATKPNVLIELNQNKLTWWSAPGRVISGRSLMAVVFVFLAHVLVDLFLSLPAANLLLLPLILAVALAIVAHYANTIEEIGPQDQDEVPVLLREVSFSQDVLHPLYGLIVAGLFSFWPAMILRAFLDHTDRTNEYSWIIVGITLLGCLVFPAAALTSVTSGALQNMLPKHVMSVIRAAPTRYAMVCGAFLVGLGGYGLAVRAMDWASINFFTQSSPLSVWRNLLTELSWKYTFLMVGIYFMHLAAVWLGLMYRYHYPSFNWVYQKHEHQNRTDVLARLEEMHRNGDRRVRQHRPTPQQLEKIRLSEDERKAQHAKFMGKI